jgi:hypothetical protein
MHASINFRRTASLVRFSAAMVAAHSLGLAQPASDATSGSGTQPTPATTQVLVSFNRPGTVDVTIDLDLAALLPSPDAYAALSTAQAGS